MRRSQYCGADAGPEFALSEGTLAGGRFIVWPGTTTLEAELTIYGSGRRIVQIERGTLVPAQ